ncbi:hypothetical protein WJU23_20680 [Prosthecobacter sp. SYSU 5D2]|uniref:hypothetical protein n=1 Tax=Prosthecobacter sp. SYSU 5D2 TaxID=3134134 RepID=UPI0031FE5CB5
MKKSHTLRALMLLSLPIASQAFGQAPPPPPGTVSKVAFSLTITDEAPGTVAKDPETGKPLKKGTEGAGPAFSNEYDSFKGKKKVAFVDEYIAKSAKRKYSIKEFLTDLKKIGVITDIKGWSLVKVTETGYSEQTKSVDETPEPTEEVPNPEVVITDYPAGTYTYEDDDGFFLVNKSVTNPIDVSDYINAYTWYEYGVYLTDEYVESTPYSSEGTITGTEWAMTTYMYNYTWRSDAYFRITLDQEIPAEGEDPSYTIEESIRMYGGLGTGGSKSGLLKDKETGVYLPLAEKATGLSGRYRYEDNSDEDSDIYAFVEGGFSISAGAVQADVLKFFPAEVD